MIIEQGTIEEILAIDKRIPEFDGRSTRDKLESRLADKPHLILIATVKGELAGYKVGYQLNSDESSSGEFYSWLGGVIPQYRNQGIATALRQYQEQWAQQSGYTSIGVKSMNRYPNMLHLLISSGYQIMGYEDGNAKGEGKIVFYKSLI
ncbi:GNAT family N-acetyltransferase [Vibrio rumoiensis]|uniref:GNAT family N-acetyltransferase n=1 Tax=Vibrio rumoiensis TaxID=76258 RepID=A0ABW7IYU8_9VIBR